MALLTARGVGVEAGLATVEDARCFVAPPGCERVFRVLIEIEAQQLPDADRIATGIMQALENAGQHRPILLHGFDATVWHFVRQASARRFSTHVGLEDGSIAAGDADLVAAAVAIVRGPAGAAQIGTGYLSGTRIYS